MSASKDPVMLVHGLYMNRLWMLPMARFLRQRGYAVHFFGYPSVIKNIHIQGQQLAEAILALKQPRVHVVAHSLGGLVIRQALADTFALPIGRIVTLGTPHQGSQVAVKVSRWSVAPLLGATRHDALIGYLPNWTAPAELASIAGNKSIGLARLVHRFDEKNDGVVSFEETQLAGQTAHQEVNESHTSMLFSEEVADQVVCFLENGSFGCLTQP